MCVVSNQERTEVVTDWVTLLGPHRGAIRVTILDGKTSTTNRTKYFGTYSTYAVKSLSPHNVTRNHNTTKTANLQFTLYNPNSREKKNTGIHKYYTWYATAVPVLWESPWPGADEDRTRAGRVQPTTPGPPTPPSSCPKPTYGCSCTPL